MSGRKEDWRQTAFIGLGLAGLGLGGALAAASGTMGKDAIPVWFMAIVGVVLLLRSPIAKAMAARMTQEPSEVPGEVAESMYAELDELRARVLELEERQDFAERLLARQGETAGEG